MWGTEFYSIPCVGLRLWDNSGETRAIQAVFCSSARQVFQLLAKMQAMKIQVDQELDVTGLRCPMPLLKAKLALNTLAPGQVLKVCATDPGSERDFHSFVQQSRHQILGFEKLDDVYFYWIQKG